LKCLKQIVKKLTHIRFTKNGRNFELQQLLISSNLQKRTLSNLQKVMKK